MRSAGYHADGAYTRPFGTGTIVFLIVAAAETGGGIRYLGGATGKTSDSKIHGAQTSKQTHAEASDA